MQPHSTALIVRRSALPRGTAGAAERWSLRGAGWGHGIGLSQYGAYGYAKQGAGYRDILDHYYRDTQIETRDGGVVRVLLQPNRSTVYFRGATQAGDRDARRGLRLQGHADRATGRPAQRDAAESSSTFDGMVPVVGGDTCGCSDAPTTACATASTAERSRSAPPPARA